MALRPFLSDRHPWLLLLRFAIPLLRGQVASDNRAVPRHYDHGNELYFAFLDRRHRLYSQALYRTGRSEEHTSELQSLMRISYAVFRLKKKKHTITRT